ncbi:MAG: hypothetical protein LKG11_00235 [Bacilli bacterium]|jgi:hypothetical protein|nr:hypothetical protein [Bacilli bacterium]
MKNVQLDEVGEEIGSIVGEYTLKVNLGIDALLDETADKIIDYIKTHAPRSGGKDPLADSFVKEIYGEGTNRIVIIYSRSKGTLIHLLEFGFRHRSGKQVAAKPFMRPAYDTFTPEMLEDMNEIIKGGK